MQVWNVFNVSVNIVAYYKRVCVNLEQIYNLYILVCDLAFISSSAYNFQLSLWDLFNFLSSCKYNTFRKSMTQIFLKNIGLREEDWNWRFEICIFVFRHAYGKAQTISVVLMGFISFLSSLSLIFCSQALFWHQCILKAFFPRYV